jgi:hypothetical protein
MAEIGAFHASDNERELELALRTKNSPSLWDGIAASTAECLGGTEMLPVLPTA